MTELQLHPCEGCPRWDDGQCDGGVADPLTCLGPVNVEKLGQRLVRLEAAAREVRDALLAAWHFSGDNDVAVVERPKQLAAKLNDALKKEE